MREKKKIKKPKNPKNWISGLLLNLSQTFSREFETKKTKSGFPSPTALKLFNLLLGWVLCKFLKKKKTEAIPRTKLFFFYLNKNWAGNLEDVQPSPSPKKKKEKKKERKSN